MSGEVPVYMQAVAKLRARTTKESDQRLLDVIENRLLFSQKISRVIRGMEMTTEECNEWVRKLMEVEP